VTYYFWSDSEVCIMMDTFLSHEATNDSEVMQQMMVGHMIMIVW